MKHPWKICRYQRAAGIALGIALLAGCLSVPGDKYYTLDMRSSGNAAAQTPFTIERLHLTEALGQRKILIQKTPTQIEYYAVDQWAAGLDELIVEKLRSEWGAPPETKEPKLLLNGTVHAFGQEDGEDGAIAHIKISLEFRKEGMSRYDNALLEKTYDLRADAEPAGADALTQALSRVLEKIAAEIAHDLGTI
jgi:uncharacterized lipoprotein YmbA